MTSKAKLIAIIIVYIIIMLTLFIVGLLFVDYVVGIVLLVLSGIMIGIFLLIVGMFANWGGR